MNGNALKVAEVADAPKGSPYPNVFVLQMIVDRIREFEREQMFIVRQDPKVAEVAKVQKGVR